MSTSIARRFYSACLVLLPGVMAFGPVGTLAEPEPEPEREARPVLLSEVRAALIREGWVPRETYGTFPDGLRWNQDGNAAALYKAGFKEVEACSSTRAHYCNFNYVRGGKCLVLHTQGEFEAGQREPAVVRRSHACPRPDIAQPAQAASR